MFKSHKLAFSSQEILLTEDADIIFDQSDA